MFIKKKMCFTKMTNKQKMNVQLWLGVGLALSGIILIFLSFIVPPLGIIHASVLAAIGEIFTFSGALIGIDYSYKYKHERMKRGIDDDGEAEDS